ncbi:DinB family protein [Amphritea sp. HPY]|uniref:DinB family protein n=1 Tax=Amphritea sp. HPY TaxID=3421652 RepID=UPI003D7E5AFA
MKAHFELLAGYNQSMNEQLYHAASMLDAEQLGEDRGAFFGSVSGTLNHLLVGDIIWLKRFAEHPVGFASLEPVLTFPSPAALSEILFSDFTELHRVRMVLDTIIQSFALEAREEDYAVALAYNNTKGKAFVKPFGFLVQHLFNHQTHHRGQISTLLSQSGVDPGVTDLLMLIPDAD